MKYAALLLALCLAGCGGAAIEPNMGRPPLDAALSAPCPDLPPLGGIDGATVYQYLHDDVVPMYYDCQARHDATVKAVQ